MLRTQPPAHQEIRKFRKMKREPGEVGSIPGRGNPRATNLRLESTSPTPNLGAPFSIFQAMD